MPITVGVLGAFTVSGQGGAVDLPGRRQRSLTAILALEGGRIVSAARLIDLLWVLLLRRPPDRHAADAEHGVARSERSPGV